MPVPVLTAVSDAVWEAELVVALERADLGVAVVRRCVDLADLLATATTGQARAVLLSADLRRLDRASLARLAVAGVAVVGLAPPGDEEAERRLRALGVAARAAVGHLARGAGRRRRARRRRARGAVGRGAGGARRPARRAARRSRRRARRPGRPGSRCSAAGEVVAVWGPTGRRAARRSPSTSRGSWRRSGRSTLLVDADVYGGVVAQVLGLLDEAPGLAAAGAPGQPGHARPAGARRPAPGRSRRTCGCCRARPAPTGGPSCARPSLEVVLELARSLAVTTVVDCAFALEQDEELAYDTAAPRRNGATLTVLAAADTVLAVGSADPVGLQRLVRGLGELREAVPGVEPLVVVNRLRGQRRARRRRGRGAGGAVALRRGRAGALRPARRRRQSTARSRAAGRSPRRRRPRRSGPR